MWHESIDTRLDHRRSNRVLDAVPTIQHGINTIHLDLLHRPPLNASPDLVTGKGERRQPCQRETAE